MQYGRNISEGPHTLQPGALSFCRTYRFVHIRSLWTVVSHHHSILMDARILLGVGYNRLIPQKQQSEQLDGCSLPLLYR
jgi:hypothetical protein